MGLWCHLSRKLEHWLAWFYNYIHDWLFVAVRYSLSKPILKTRGIFSTISRRVRLTLVAPGCAGLRWNCLSVTEVCGPYCWHVNQIHKKCKKDTLWRVVTKKKNFFVGLLFLLYIWQFRAEINHYTRAKWILQSDWSSINPTYTTCDVTISNWNCNLSPWSATTWENIPGPLLFFRTASNRKLVKAWECIVLPTGSVFQKQGSGIGSGRDFISGCFRNSAGEAYRSRYTSPT